MHKLYQRRKRLKPQQLAEFCRQVGAMQSAGVPQASAMEILRKGTEKKSIRNLYGQLQNLMEQGMSFSDALEETGVFPEFLLHMFRAAEAGGKLESTAEHMADCYKKEHRIKNQIRTATLYPKLLCIVSLVVVLTIFLVVIPTVESLFEGMDLPLLTKVLLIISRLLCEHWRIGLVFLVSALLLVGYLSGKPKVIWMKDRLKVKAPVVGKYYRVIYTSRFARSESGLYSSGLPLVEGLEIAARTIGNRYLEGQFEHVIRMIRGGKSLSHAIESVDGMDKKLASVIFVGEETGRLDEMLEHIADGYEHDAEVAIQRLVAMIEPVMIVIMGVVIGAILLGIMMPMWSMYEYIV